jgi:hypothetical protein
MHSLNVGMLCLVVTSCGQSEPSASKPSSEPARSYVPWSGELGMPAEGQLRIRAVAPGQWEAVTEHTLVAFELVASRDMRVKLEYAAPNQGFVIEQLIAETILAKKPAFDHSVVSTGALDVKRGESFVAFLSIGRECPSHVETTNTPGLECAGARFGLASPRRGSFAGGGMAWAGAIHYARSTQEVFRDWPRHVAGSERAEDVPFENALLLYATVRGSGDDDIVYTRDAHDLELTHHRGESVDLTRWPKPLAKLRLVTE